MIIASPSPYTIFNTHLSLPPFMIVFSHSSRSLSEIVIMNQLNLIYECDVGSRSRIWWASTPRRPTPHSRSSALRAPRSVCLTTYLLNPDLLPTFSSYFSLFSSSVFLITWSSYSPSDFSHNSHICLIGRSLRSSFPS